MGWDLNGHPVDLTSEQTSAVMALLDWDTSTAPMLPVLGTPGERTTVLCTAARYDRARAVGAPLDSYQRAGGLW